MSHVPVLMDEAIAALDLKAGDLAVDATFGGGGYSRAILAACDCRLIAIDRDPAAAARAAPLQKAYPKRFELRAGRFGDLAALVEGPIDALVFDLGVSSFQLDEGARGFSFRLDGPLDMRMSLEGPSAADVVNALPEQGLAAIFYRLGEEPAARRMARAIVAARAAGPIDTAQRLSALLVEAAGPAARKRPTHPATRAFQALRMYVNEELEELRRALSAAEQILAPGGRLVSVAFHSLEDRMVKNFLAERSGGLTGGSRHRPETRPLAPSFALSKRKAGKPQDAEIAANPRARSARLRAGVRTDAPSWGPFDFDLPDLPPLAALEHA